MKAAAEVEDDVFSENSFDASDFEEGIIEGSKKAKIESAYCSGAARSIMKKQKLVPVSGSKL